MTGSELSPGTVFAEQFRVVRTLVVSAFGARYEVEQLGTGHARALEVLHPALAQSAGARERFARQTQAAARIESEHVAEVIAAGIDAATGAPWIVTEVLKGESLAASVARRGALPPDEVLAIFRQLCHALSAAHAAGVVHGDVRPENVFLAESRRSGGAFTVKVAAFGVARWLHEAVSSTPGQSALALGPPLWRAPELSDPQRASAPVADVWALGLLAYYLLTGSYYWASAGESAAPWPQLVSEVMYGPLEPAAARAAWSGRAATLPQKFDAWFSHCVVRDESHRFSNATAVMNSLEPVLAAAASSSSQVRGSFAPATPHASDLGRGAFGVVPSTEATDLASVPYGFAPAAHVTPSAHSDSIAWSESAEPPPPAPVPPHAFSPTRSPAPAPGIAVAPAAREKRGRALPVALFVLAVAAGAAGIVAWVKLREGSLGHAPTAAVPGTPTHGAAPEPAGPRTSARGCAGTWTGTLLDFSGSREATVSVTDIQGGLCGHMRERMASGENCEFPLSGCAVSDLFGSTVLVANGTTTVPCASRLAITLTCVGSNATLVGTVENGARQGRAAGGSLQRR